jgi:hypothetical protein
MSRLIPVARELWCVVVPMPDDYEVIGPFATQKEAESFGLIYPPDCIICRMKTAEDCDARVIVERLMSRITRGQTQ